MQRITFPGHWIDACIFNGHLHGSVPPEVAEQGCIPIAEGMESEVNYNTLLTNRLEPETWMRSYRLDEEIPATYFNFQEYPLVKAGPPLKARERSACVIVSNCSPSHRARMIATLKSYIDVAFYGTCGTRPWPNDCGQNANERCSKLEVMHRHVIYLAFENSVTQDYVTEKLYDGLSAGAVTVAYGAPNALDLAPKGSIIAIKGEADGVAVGERLKRMLADPSLEEATKQVSWYHNASWRAEWEERMSFTRLHSDCRLCDMLRRRVVIATGATSEQFSELKATVATLHKIERKRKIIVFDMGLTAWQMEQVGTWEDTVLVKLFEYTAKSSAAWTRRTAALLFALHAAGSVLWLDAGTRVQRRLAHIDSIIEREGIFVVEEAAVLGVNVHSQTLYHLGLAEAHASALPLLSYSVVGFKEGTAAYERIALALAGCVFDQACVAPPERDTPPSAHANAQQAVASHRFDQAVLSVVAATANLDIRSKQHAALCVQQQAPADARALLALPRAAYSSDAQGSSWIGAEVIYKPGTCVQSVGSRELKGATLINYMLKGQFSVQRTPLSAVEVWQGRDLEACTFKAKNDTSQEDGYETVRECTGGGISIKAELDLAGHDLEKGQFVHIQDRNVGLRDCIRECWTNANCQGFSYDLSTGYCWPKNSADAKHGKIKSTVISGFVSSEVRKSMTSEKWAEQWRKLGCDAEH